MPESSCVQAFRGYLSGMKTSNASPEALRQADSLIAAAEAWDAARKAERAKVQAARAAERAQRKAAHAAEIASFLVTLTPAARAYLARNGKKA